MPYELIFSLSLGLAVGFAVAVPFVRSRRVVLRIALAGGASALLYSAIPLIQGLGYVQGGLKRTVLFACLGAGFCLLFSSAKTK